VELSVWKILANVRTTPLETPSLKNMPLILLLNLPNYTP